MTGHATVMHKLTGRKYIDKNWRCNAVCFGRVIKLSTSLEHGNRTKGLKFKFYKFMDEERSW